jgi:predicted RNA-binding Zn-ribbon protein involved in translation (DUF1610 family)
MSDRYEDGRVAPRHACPGCGEDRLDWLVWQDDEQVRCSTCGTVYEPGEPHPILVFPAPPDDGPRAA